MQIIKIEGFVFQTLITRCCAPAAYSSCCCTIVVLQLGSSIQEGIHRTSFIGYRNGRERVELGLFDWAKEVADRGAGEILFTSMDHDGVKQGFANEALTRLAEEVSIPIIASGGAGKMEHFRDAFTQGKADAALAASVFHFGEIAIPDLKKYLREEGINVRI